MPAVAFISIADVANERKVGVRTIYRRIRRGMFPPLPGDQKGLPKKDQGWPAPYYNEWCKQEARKNFKKFNRPDNR